MTEPSLRERSKERRRRAVQVAGMRLFAERGYEATTVSDIAAEAEVSTRSVSMYFDTKLDIALSSSDAAAARLTAALAEAPSGAPVTEVFLAWLEREPALVGEEEWLLRSRMLERNPQLGSGGTDQARTMLRASADAVAADLGTTSDDVAVQVVLGVLAGVLYQFERLSAVAREDRRTLDVMRAAVDGAFAGVRRRG
ncbi:TetR family transcriptional regulator [Rathayibacter caricis]|uniref:TetR/AcrR family transcriptional regulator n=1 Tax=Rathayibacter caricis TaxID=110936 RepID=UPI001FB3801D|nr:TetR family transcriptional regulator [Rathayibacter caricis]MCJ1697262.1 TetR family transcriptional regulator [Rathayibacter caricis]